MQGVGTGRLVASRYALRQRRAALGAIEVWAATDSTLGREVSVTVLPVSDPHAEPLLEAARRSAAVNDHRLVRVLDVGSRGEVAWVVEESLSESTSIADLLSDGPLPPEEARRIAGEVASALDVASREGLHHLHVTPHAVRRTKAGLVKIAGLSTAAAVEGTPVPDAAEAQRIDALGVVGLLYAAMTARWPLRSSVPGLDAAPRVGGTVVPPSEIAVAVPTDLDALCRDTFARSAAPRTPAEVVTRLGAWSHTLVRHVAPRAQVAAPTEMFPRVGRAEAPRAGAGAAPVAAAATARTTTAAPARKISHREMRAHEKAAQAAEERREIAARRRDPSFLDVPEALEGSSGPLEPPAPLVAAPVEREGRYAKYVLGAVGGVLLLAALLSIKSLSSAFDEMSAATAPGTGPARSTAPATPGASPSTAAPAQSSPTTSITFSGAKALDPEGDGGENNGGIRKAYDGDPATYWQSEGYKAPDYQGQKSGVGMAFELPDGASVSSLSVILGDGPQTGTISVSQNRSPENATQVGTFDNATGEQQVTIPENERSGARFVIVWITSAMKQDDDRYRAIISEVTAR